jgi:hypothetical protein
MGKYAQLVIGPAGSGKVREKQLLLQYTVRYFFSSFCVCHRT